MGSALLLFGGLALAVELPHSADVSFYDEQGGFQSYQLGYFIAPEEIDTGFKFGVEVYNVSLANCAPQMDAVDEDYFAAYVLIPANCSVAEVIYELGAHGADFVFVDAAQSGLSAADTFNKYPQPVFFLDATVVRNLFQLSPEHPHRYITVYLREEGPAADIASLQLFYEPGYTQLPAYLAVLAEVCGRLGPKAVFEPLPITFASSDAQFARDHCLADGLYCAFPPSSRAQVTGRAVVEEALRQLCVARLSPRHYLTYMDHLARMCGERLTADCAANAATRAGLQTGPLSACVEESLRPEGLAVLVAQRQKAKALGLRQFPEIAINGAVYRGTLAKFDLLLSACAALGDASDDCKDLGLEAANDLDLPSVLVAALLLFGLAVLLMAWLCKKVARERYMSELNRTISKYVAEYAEYAEAGEEANM